MRDNFLKDEQRLAQLTTEVSKQMTELRQLKELVRLAEATGLLDQPKGLARQQVNSKVIDQFAGPQLRV